MPPDIERRLRTLFADPAELQEATTLIESLWVTRLAAGSATAVTLGVGADQLARSILIISAGDLAVMREIFSSHFWGDPRDVLVEADKRTDGTARYGIAPFRD